MFSAEELQRVAERPEFRDDWAEVIRGQAGFRMAQPLLLSGSAARRLQRFVGSVLVSAPRWLDDDSRPLIAQAAQAAQAAEALSRCSARDRDQDEPLRLALCQDQRTSQRYCKDPGNRSCSLMQLSRDPGTGYG